MKRNIVILAGLCLGSCSSIDVERESPLVFDRLFFAKVESREAVTLEPNESMSGRVLVGLVSAGPVGAVATANTEEGFSEPKAYEYRLQISADERRVIVSRSIADEGECVEVISSGKSDLELLRVVAESSCDAEL